MELFVSLVITIALFFSAIFSFLNYIKLERLEKKIESIVDIIL